MTINDSQGGLLSISGKDWFIKKDESEFGFKDSDLFKENLASWIPARVPGNIQSDLEAAHQLKPLWYGLGDPALADVARHDWWYCKEFAVPEGAKDQRTRLVFCGVDYACEVWLNGVKLGIHEGMFQKFGFDISQALLFGQSNRLYVRIKRMPEHLVQYLVGSDGGESGYRSPYYFVTGMNKTRQFLKGLKSVTNFAYDWGTNIWTLGVWKDVFLEITGPARIDWLQVQSKLSGNYQQAEIPVTLEIDSLKAMTANAVISLAGPGVNLNQTVKTALKKGKNRIKASLEVNNPALWWPNGQGGQPLYEVTASLENVRTGEILDSKKTRIGIREVRWGQVEGAPEDFINPLRLILNGRTIRTMGSNLIPPDLLFGRIMDRGPRLLQLARETGMNMLRIWGGGVILPDDLYGVADELGIMLSLEFPIANCRPEDDPVFLANLDETTRNIVKQIRNHPSIIEWAGGNEMSWKNGDDIAALHVFENVVREEDDRIFRATCPAQGARHSPWNYNPETHYKHYDSALRDSRTGTDMMRYGEFGCQSPANLEVWHREIPPGSQWPVDSLDDYVLIRKNVSRAVFGTDFWLLKKYIDSLFGPPENLEMLVKAGQLIGAEGLRYAMDALRRRGKKLGGFTSWDYNEPWPNGAGSYLVDYDGRPLMIYDYVRQALAPVSLSLKYDSILFDQEEGLRTGLYMVSDAVAPVADLCWQWIARDMRGKIIGQGKGKTSVNPLDVLKLQELNVVPKSKNHAAILFVELFLRNQENEIISERVYLFGRKDSPMPLQGLLGGETKNRIAMAELTLVSCETAADSAGDTLKITLKNTGKMTALFCEPHPLLEYRTDVSITNNQAFIPPGDTRTLVIAASADAQCGLNLAQTGWLVSCWNAADILIPPARDVVLAMGRRDALCREFAGYSDSGKKAESPVAELTGSMIKGSELKYLLGQDIRTVRFLFDADETNAGKQARLRIHTADQSNVVETALGIVVNGKKFSAGLPRGLGVQEFDPAHLAFPQSIEITLPAGLLKTSGNTLKISVENEGWFTWDALDLIVY